MTPEQRDFIQKNYRKLSVRHIARTLGLPRPEVEKIIRETKETGTAADESGPLSGPKTIGLAAAFFAAAFAVRLCYIYFLKTTPFFEPLSKILDDGVYDGMALEISRGNWMADMPYSAYRIPLYPYFLAVIYHFFGRSMMAVHLIQSFLGSLTPVILFFISKQIFKNVRAAVITGILASFYVPFIFYDNLLLGESLSVLFILTGLLLLLRGRIFFSGIFFGVSILFRPNVLLAVLALAAVVWVVGVVKDQKTRKGMGEALIFLAASLVLIVPVTARNYVLHKDFLPITAVGGVNLYLGNNPEADGKFSLAKGIGTSLNEMIENSEKIAQKETGRVLKPSEVSSFWTKKAIGFAMASPGRFLALTARKAAYLFNHYEFPDILGMDFVAQFIPIFGMNPFSYGFMVVFGVYGLFLSYRERNAAAWLPIAFFAGYAVSVIMFFVTARYRLPLAPLLIVFASFAIHRLAQGLTRERTFGFLQWFVISAALSVLVFWPVERTTFGTNYNSLGVAFKKKGQFEQAEKYYRKAMEIEPRYPSSYYNFGLLLKAQGKDAEAREYFRKYEEAKTALG